METVTHRELRNDSGSVLRRAREGETLGITNNGELAAVIGPPAIDAVTDLAARGLLRPALADPASLRSIVRRRSGRRSAELLSDSRGTW